MLRNLLLLVCLSAPQVAANDYWLVINPDASALQKRIALHEGDGWCLHWQHSVAGFTVKDCFRIDAGRLLLESSHQPDFAAGLGHIEGRGVQVSDGRGGYWIRDINSPLPHNSMRLRVGSKEVNHRLVFDDLNKISLSEPFANQGIELYLQPRTEN
ncbi:protein of unknown function [Marinospirillum celere]|uniref:DUF1850 domain-containing protein n=1 Tax=Marinospirillum celere TaxID=1122252 RepID=A0A1I1JJG6_9GAMM|nr:DUF1850 domain-containing protein [Marinospirillum celere]SFC48616.1 protein of unknown function [Marinospirillum celere]